MSISTIRQQWLTIVLSYATAVCIALTIFYAYNGCLDRPIFSALIAKRPQQSILILNILSQATIFLLCELTTSIFEITRWAFACTTSGVPAYTFLALSRATNTLGVLSLLREGKESGKKWTYDDHRIWGTQR